MRKVGKRRKAAAASHDATGRRTAAINRSLRCGLRIDGERLSIGDVPLDMPESVRSMLLDHVIRGVGTSAALARRLSSYGLSEWERRFSSVFHQDEVAPEWAARARSGP